VTLLAQLMTTTQAKESLATCKDKNKTNASAIITVLSILKQISYEHQGVNILSECRPWSVVTSVEELPMSMVEATTGKNLRVESQ